MSEPAVAPTPEAPAAPPLAAPPEAPAIPTPGVAPGDWRSALPSDLQAHPTLADTKSVESLARQHIDLSTMIGKKGVIPPSDDSEAEMNRYYGELGRPDEASGYTFASMDAASKTPEQIGFLDNLRPSYHRNGLTDAQADGVTADYFAMVDQQKADQAQMHAEQAKTTTADLHKKWGLAYETRREMAERAGFHLFGEETLRSFADATMADGSRVGDHPDFIEKLYNNLGAHMTEDQLTVGSQASSVMSPEGAAAEIKRLETDKDFAPSYFDRTHPEHVAAQARMKALYKQAYPEGGAPQ